MMCTRATERLLVHAHLPRCGADELNRKVFSPRYGEAETLLAYDDSHGRSARFSPDDPLAERALRGARLALGRVPYGYFDGFERWTLYISVFDDPVARFLRFVSWATALPGEIAASLLPGLEDVRAAGDPEALSDALLAQPLVRRRQCDGMVRAAAGMPLLAGGAPDRRALAVAVANLRRINYMAARRADLPRFIAFLRDMIGEDRAAAVEKPAADKTAAAERGPSSALARRLAATPQGGRCPLPPRAARLQARDFSPAAIARIEAANALDMDLYERLCARREWE